MVVNTKQLCPIPQSHHLIPSPRYNLDLNAPTELLKKAEAEINREGLNSQDAEDFIKEIKIEAAYLEENAFPQVHPVTASTDDRNIPVSTSRAWLMRLTWTIIGTDMSTSFDLSFLITLISTTDSDDACLTLDLLHGET